MAFKHAKKCKAKAKSTGKQCRRVAVGGYDVCQVHGAGSPKNGRPGGGPIKHGRYSKRYKHFLTDERAQYVKEALEDGEILSLLSSVAVLDSRFAELLGRIELKDAQALYQQIKQCYADAEEALRESDSVTFKAKWRELGDLVENRINDYHIWSEIRMVAEDKRRLIDTETKRIKAMAEIVRIEDAKIFVNRLVELVSRHVDNKGLSVLLNDIERELTTTFSTTDS